MNWTRTRHDLVLSFGSQIAYKAIGFAILALLARYLTKTGFGEWMFALSLAGVLVLFTELGTTNHLIRQVASAPGRALRATGEVLTMRLALFAAYMATICVFTALFKPGLFALVVIAALYMGLKDLYRTFAGLFLGLKRIEWAIVAFGASILALLAWVAAAIALDAGARVALWGYGVSGGLAILLGWILTRQKIGRIELGWEPAGLSRVVKGSFVIFLLIVLEFVHFKFDTLMLGFLRSYAEVAVYEAGAKLLEASQSLIRPVTLIFYPICAELVSNASWGPLSALYRRMTWAAGGLGAGIALLVMAVASVIIPIVFGPAFERAIPVLRVLYLAVPGLYVATIASFVLLSMHRERVAVAVLAGGVVLNVGLNAVVIPRWGALGAAWATAASQSIIALGLCWSTARSLRHPVPIEGAGTLRFIRDRWLT